MDIFGDSFLWILFVLVLFVGYWYTSIPSNIPPGPLGLPIVGYLPFLSKEPHLRFETLGKKYGNVFHVYFGSALVVILNDFEAVKDAFVKQGEAFSGRIQDPGFQNWRKENFGLVFNDGSYWKEHRRFVLSNLRNNGVGKLALEPPLLSEIEYFLTEMKRHSGKPHDVYQLLFNSLANNVILLITGQRYDYDQPMMAKALKIIRNTIKFNQSMSYELVFPWVKYIPGIDVLTKTKRKQANWNQMSDSVKSMISKVKPNSDNSDDTYVQAYMSERDKKLNQTGNAENFTEIGLNHISRDFFAAGTETSSSTLLWLMLYLSHNPEIQTKVQKEIDSTIGKDRTPSYADRLMTPYTEATILEILRVTSLLPLALPHRTTRAVSVLGHPIPKDTMVFANLFAVHGDPKLWGDPQNFRPERFIGEDGKVNKPDYLIPFSIGKRACAGEPLARMELYLYFVSLMQRFTFVPTLESDQTLKAMPTFVRTPLYTTVCAMLR